MKPATALAQFQQACGLQPRWYSGRNAQIARWRGLRLGALRFSATPHFNPNYPQNVPIPLAGPARTTHYEVWTTTRPIHTDTSHGIRFAEDGQHLFGWLAVSEDDFKDIEETTRRAHVAILRLLDAQQYPFWIRAWNYLSAITEGSGARERYRRFNAGRHRVFARVPGFEHHLPAATTIGTHRRTGLRIAFLASRVPGVQVENPRQLSAFRYPRFYGAQAPSFSRAVLQHWPDRLLLFVSGTGSIVGHATQHPGDARARFDETLRNIDALLEHAAHQNFATKARHQFQLSSAKLYVRDAQTLAAIGQQRRADLEARGPTAVLYGDFCRRDLLLEIEAVFEWCHR